MGWPYLICFLEITCTSARELLRDLGKKCGMTYEDKVKVDGQGHPNGHSATNLRDPQGAEYYVRHCEHSGLGSCLRNSDEQVSSQRAGEVKLREKKVVILSCSLAAAFIHNS